MSLALSLVLTACGGGSSHPGDAGADRTPDAKAKLDTGAVDTGADRRDTGAGTEAGADRADTGGVDTHGDMTTSSADASDARDTGPGVDVQPDIAPDLAPDVAPDVQPDLPPIDTGTDAMAPSDASDGPPACGTGCPSTIQPDNLAYWFAADYGVTCTGGRVSAWANRGTLDPQIAPPSGKSGPLCNSTTPLGGRNAIFFDDSGADELSGVLQIDLDSALSGNDYTIFVVERRQSGAEGYVLGTALDPALLNTDCSQYAHAAYWLGYLPPYLLSGPYITLDGDTCEVPQMMPALFSMTNPVASLDIDLFDSSVGHACFSNGVAILSDNDMDPIDSLFQGYVGRAFQTLDSGSRPSRFKGDIAEIVIYSTALSSDERTAVSSYLATRWGLP